MSKLKDKIKTSQDVRAEKVPIPEWDVTIEVRTMKAIDRARLLKNCVDAKGAVIREKFQAGLIIASCFDPETGEKIFSDDDYDLVMDKSAGPVEYLSGIAMRISGLNRETMETAEKNS
jgi:hypothetical protein